MIKVFSITDLSSLEARLPRAAWRRVRRENPNKFITLEIKRSTWPENEGPGEARGTRETAIFADGKYVSSYFQTLDVEGYPLLGGIYKKAKPDA